MKKITMCITSYNRFDLLQQTIDSFLSINTYPIARIIVVEDSAVLEIRDNILSKYGDRVDLIFNEQRIGQPLSIDKMYKTVDTDYIFHSEDDYVYIGNSNFIKDSIEILEEKKDVHQIWIRHLQNYVVSHGEHGLRLFEKEIFSTSSGIQYRKVIISDDKVWGGFSWNPGIKRTSDYHAIFPNGYGEFFQPENINNGAVSEWYCSKHSLSAGYRGALLVNGACNNIGIGRESYK